MKSRATLTRMAAGGLLLGPVGAVLSLGFKKHKNVDLRELYLLVEGPGYGTVVSCTPDQGLGARQFATRLNTAASQAVAQERMRPAQIAAVRSELQAARANTGSIVAAQSELKRVRQDAKLLGSVQATQLALEQAKARWNVNDKHVPFGGTDI